MKLILLFLVLLMAAQTQAGLFDNDAEQQRWREYEQIIQTERQSTGGWQIVAGVLCIGGVILFTIGTAIGSKTKRDHGNAE